MFQVWSVTIVSKLETYICKYDVRCVPVGRTRRCLGLRNTRQLNRYIVIWLARVSQHVIGQQEPGPWWLRLNHTLTYNVFIWNGLNNHWRHCLCGTARICKWKTIFIKAFHCSEKHWYTKPLNIIYIERESENGFRRTKVIVNFMILIQ